MNPKVNAKTERAKAIRDHVLPLLRKHGHIDETGSLKALMWQALPWSFVHRTPFSPPPAPDLKGIGHHGAVALQKRGKLNLGYSLDIWKDDKKVFNIEWDDPDELQIVSFKRGEWEDQVLAMK